MTRPRKERITADFKRIRDELFETLKNCKPEEFDWQPRPGMKSVKAMLRECGTLERVAISVMRDGKAPDWEKAVAWSGEDLSTTLKDLEKIRQETLAFLHSCTEAQLDKVYTLRPGRDLEGEELFRLITRHEYYHSGQIIYNRWLLGYNPYQVQQK
jgi:uncharacterized damage-inducible protein DinB